MARGKKKVGKVNKGRNKGNKGENKGKGEGEGEGDADKEELIQDRPGLENWESVVCHTLVWIQTLAYTKCKRFLLKLEDKIQQEPWENSAAKELLQLFQNLSGTETGSYSSEDYLKKLHGEDYVPEEEDAESSFLKMYGHLEELVKNNEEEKKALENLFVIKYTETIICSACYSDNADAPETSRQLIHLEVPQGLKSKQTLEMCMQRFCSYQGPLFCKKCRQDQNSFRTRKITRCPRILIFSCSTINPEMKIDLKYPKKIKWSSECLQDQQTCGRSYNLKADIMRVPLVTEERYHYIANVFVEDNWYNFDDLKVKNHDKLVCPEDYLNETGRRKKRRGATFSSHYVLLLVYEREKSDPPDDSSDLSETEDKLEEEQKNAEDLARTIKESDVTTAGDTIAEYAKAMGKDVSEAGKELCETAKQVFDKWTKDPKKRLRESEEREGGEAKKPKASADDENGTDDEMVNGGEITSGDEQATDIESATDDESSGTTQKAKKSRREKPGKPKKVTVGRRNVRRKVDKDDANLGTHGTHSKKCGKSNTGKRGRRKK